MAGTLKVLCLLLLKGGPAAARVHLPVWLSVQPVCGIVPAGGCATVSFGCNINKRLAGPLGVRPKPCVAEVQISRAASVSCRSRIYPAGRSLDAM